MRPLLTSLLFILWWNGSLIAQTFTWNGSISSNWGTNTNWTPNGIPGAGSTVQINSAAMPNPCQLDANRTIGTLTVSAGTLNLGGFQLTCSNSASFSGGTVQSGTISTASFAAMANTTFSGTMAFSKTGGTNNDLAGGNTFNGPVTFTQNGSRRLRLAITNGDTYNNSATFVNLTNREFDVAYNGNNTFSGNLTITNSGTAGITLAAINTAGATVTIASGAALRTAGYTNAPLIMYRVTQNGTAANGSFSPTELTVSNCTFHGNFSVNTTAGNGSMTITASSFTATNTIAAAGGISLVGANNFSTVSGNTSITKNGGNSNETWAGGNSFGNVTITNNTNRRIRMANATGDTFTGTATFVNTASGGLEISYFGTNSFNQNITLNNSGSGGISFGVNGGTSTLSNGAVVSTSFINGPLTISNFTQSQVFSNGAMNPTTFSCTSCTFLGNFSMTTTAGSLTLASSSFTASNSFTSSAGLTVTGANNFSTASGSTSITKNGGGADLWAGGNTFGPVTFTNNSTGELRLASTTADTYTGSATFVRTSSGAISPAYAGNNNFAGDISTVGSTTAITFGGGSGRVILNGSTNHNFYGASAQTPVITRLTMNTTGNGQLVLSVPLNITASLILNTGNIITTATNILTLTDETAVTTVGSANSYIEGPMQYNLNSNSAARSTLNFPIGKASDWRPVSLRVAHSTTTSYTYRAEVINESARDLGWTLPGTAPIVSDVRYWDIGRYLTSTMVSTPSAGLSTGIGQAPEVTLYFGLNDGVVDGADLVVCKNTTGAPTSWVDIGGTGTPPYAGGSFLSGSVTSTSSPSAFNSFSIFSLGSFANNPLPVTLASFSAAVQGSRVNLEWHTEAEINSRDFSVERSANGVDFETLITLQAAGNSTTAQYYAAVDPDPHRGVSYYRLRQTDLDNSTVYYAVKSVTVQNPSVANSFRLYPNPCTEEVVLTPAGGLTGSTEVKVYSANGQLVLSQSILDESTIRINTSWLPQGLYLVETGTPDNPIRLKFFKI